MLAQLCDGLAFHKRGDETLLADSCFAHLQDPRGFLHAAVIIIYIVVAVIVVVVVVVVAVAITTTVVVGSCLHLSKR